MHTHIIKVPWAQYITEWHIVCTLLAYHSNPIRRLGVVPQCCVLNSTSCSPYCNFNSACAAVRTRADEQSNPPHAPFSRVFMQVLVCNYLLMIT